MSSTLTFLLIGEAHSDDDDEADIVSQADIRGDGNWCGKSLAEACMPLWHVEERIYLVPETGER